MSITSSVSTPTNVSSKEQQPKKQNLFILIILSILVIVLIVYFVFYFLKNKSEEKRTVEVPTIKSKTLTLNDVKLDATLLKTEEFKGLHLFGDLPIKVSEKGKSNPFSTY